ncbi:MAG: hypothetical protein ACK53Y_07215, partial [bacterium]
MGTGRGSLVDGGTLCQARAGYHEGASILGLADTSHGSGNVWVHDFVFNRAHCDTRGACGVLLVTARFRSLLGVVA